MYDITDPGWSKNALRIYQGYNLKVDGGYDREEIVIELVKEENDPLGFRIRIQSAVNGASRNTLLYMKLAEFLNLLGVKTKRSEDGPSHKEGEHV